MGNLSQDNLQNTSGGLISSSSITLNYTVELSKGVFGSSMNQDLAPENINTIVEDVNRKVRLLPSNRTQLTTFLNDGFNQKARFKGTIEKTAVLSVTVKVSGDGEAQAIQVTVR